MPNRIIITALTVAAAAHGAYLYTDSTVDAKADGGPRCFDSGIGTTGSSSACFSSGGDLSTSGNATASSAYGKLGVAATARIVSGSPVTGLGSALSAGTSASATAEFEDRTTFGLPAGLSSSSPASVLYTFTLGGTFSGNGFTLVGVDLRAPVLGASNNCASGTGLSGCTLLINGTVQSLRSVVIRASLGVTIGQSSVGTKLYTERTTSGDFAHTLLLTGIDFSVNGTPLTPGSFSITSDSGTQYPLSGTPPPPPPPTGAVPEPSSIALCSAGVFALLFSRIGRR